MYIGTLYASGATEQAAGRWAVIVLIYLFVVAFAMSWAVVNRIYCSEIQPMATRAAATSLGQCANWVRYTAETRRPITHMSIAGRELDHCIFDAALPRKVVLGPVLPLRHMRGLNRRGLHPIPTRVPWRLFGSARFSVRRQPMASHAVSCECSSSPT